VAGNNVGLGPEFPDLGENAADDPRRRRKAIYISATKLMNGTLAILYAFFVPLRVGIG